MQALENMSEETTPITVDFISFHKPALMSGEYRIEVTQTLSIDNDKKLDLSDNKDFEVAGERFHLLPTHVQSVFPPAHSQADHSLVFPHIMLSRNTLPWERKAIARGGNTENEDTPWLALLVVHESEMNQVEESIVTLGEIEGGSSESPYFPGITTPEHGQTETTKIEVLDISKGLLETILPDATALKYLTHVRQLKNDNGGIAGADVATLVANRLPQKGTKNTVYMVSLEGRFKKEGNTFNYQSSNASEDKIRLIKLYSWEFTSTEHFKVSAAHLQKASTLPEDIKTKLETLNGADFYTETAFEKALKEQAKLDDSELTQDIKEEIFKYFGFGDFAQILKHLDRTTTTLRLPNVGDSTANDYLQKGFYPLPHQMRQGAQTVSWYHGPLAPQANNQANFAFPAKGADALLRYYEANGMFDVSYAAAWELGRLLSLQNKSFSTALYQWKRRYARHHHHQSQQNPTNSTGNIAHLITDHQATTKEELPPKLSNWLVNLEHLEGVPFNYLVPDEKLLPVESIRFFKLDKHWVQSLLDGALSIGRVTSSDHALDKKIIEEENLLTANEITGFILRSEAVAGYPAMQADGYKGDPTPANKLPLVRRAKLSDNVLLCLFEGDLKTLDLHLKPEVLHFGVNADYTKNLRNEKGVELDNVKVNVPIDVDNNILDVSGLITSINQQKNNGIAWADSPNSALLALQMLEGVELVRFEAG